MKLKELALELVEMWTAKKPPVTPDEDKAKTTLAADPAEGEGQENGTPSVDERLAALETKVNEIIDLLNEKLKASADGDVAMKKHLEDLNADLTAAKEQLTKLSKEPDRTVHLKKTLDPVNEDPQVAMLLAKRKAVSKN